MRTTGRVKNESCARGGFTLLELLLVLAVVVGMAVVGFSSYGSFGESRRLDRLADDVRGLVGGLRVRAMEDGRAYQLAYRPETGDWMVRTPHSAVATEGEVKIGPMRYDAADLLGLHQLEHQFVFLAPEISQEPTSFVTDLEQSGWIVHEFRPDGSSDDFAIGIQDTEGTMIRVLVHGRTGRTQVEGPLAIGPAAGAMGGSPRP